MHARIKELFDYLDVRREELRAAVEGIPDGQRELQPAPDRWSVAGVIEHLALLETRLIGLFKKRIAEGRAAGVGPDNETSSVLASTDFAILLDRTRRLTAPETIQPKTNTDAVSAWRALEQAREGLRSTILEADGLALTEIFETHRVFGPMDLYKWIAFVGGHEARHAAQIREIGAQLALATADPPLRGG
jgi:uncharacterized damage-inducible protein DinB